MNMTGEIIFNITFSELLNFVNIFCSIQFISNKLCSNGSRMKSKNLKIESKSRSKGKGGQIDAWQCEAC